MATNKTAAAVAWCEQHKKLLYPSRKRARQVAKNPGLDHKNRAYECKQFHPGLWHIGELPPDVVRGRIGRDQIKQKVA